MTAIHTDDYHQLCAGDLAIYTSSPKSGHSSLITQSLVSESKIHGLEIKGHKVTDFANKDLGLELNGFVRLEYVDDVPYLKTRKTNVAYLMETLRLALGEWHHGEMLRQSIWMDFYGSFEQSRLHSKQLAESCMKMLVDIYDEDFSCKWYEAMEKYSKEKPF
jgi:hypothetical protein